MFDATELSSGCRICPSADIRSGMPRVSVRSASGSAWVAVWGLDEAKSSDTPPRRRMCSKPSLVSRATFDPFRSATVNDGIDVLLTTVAMSAADTLLISRSSRSPVKIPDVGSAGVEGTFVAYIFPELSSRRDKSVNVPPISIPRRAAISLNISFYIECLADYQMAWDDRFGARRIRVEQSTTDRGAREAV